jgi:acetyltransferase-like isoleucine patch superfamily enzyme
MDWVSTHPLSYNKSYGYVSQNIPIEGITDKKTEVGHDVWIGANVTILAGVKIGNGAVLGANALVTSDVEPYSVVSGSPARHIKWRFDEDTIMRLQQSEWWNWDDEKLKRNIHLFNDPKKFIESV